MGCKILEKTAQGWKEVKDKEPMLYRQLLNELKNKNNDYLFYSSNPTDLINTLLANSKKSMSGPHEKVTGIVSYYDQRTYTEPTTPVEIFISDYIRLFGSGFHACMEPFGQNSKKQHIDQQKLMLDFLQKVKEALDLKTYTTTNKPVKTITLSDDDVAKIRKMIPILTDAGMANMSQYIKNASDNIYSKIQEDGAVFLTELQLNLELPSVKTKLIDLLARKGKPTDLQYLTGIVDMIKIKKDGSIVLYDFKTHLHYGGSNASFNAILQLSIYKEMISQILNIPLSKIDIQVVDIAAPSEANKDFNVSLGAPIAEQLAEARSAASDYIGIQETITVDVQSQIEKDNKALADILHPQRQGLLLKENLKERLKDKVKYRALIKEGAFVTVEGDTITFSKGNPMSLDDFIEAECKKIISLRQEKSTIFAETLDKAQTNAQALSKLGNNESSRKQFINNLKFITNSSYKYIEHKALEAQGIVLLQNLNTKAYTIIKIHNYPTLSHHPKMKVGHSILGDYIPDNLVPANIRSIETNMKNIEILRTLTLLHNNEDTFSGNIVIEDILLIDSKTGNKETSQELLQINQALLFAKEHQKDNVSYKISDKIRILNNASRIENQLITLVNDLGITWTLDGDLTRIQKINKLKTIVETIRQQYSGDVHVGLNDWKDTDADRVVRMLGEYILLLEGSKVDPNKVTDTAMDKVNTVGIIGSIFNEGEVAKYAGDGFMFTGLFNGRRTSIAYANPDNTVHLLQKYINSRIDLARKKLMQNQKEINDATYKFLEAHSSWAQKNLLGTRNIYLRLFQKDSSGELDPNMLLLNPYKSNSLDPASKEYLEVLLWTFNRFRMKEVLSEEDRHKTLQEFKKSANYAAYVTAVNQKSEYLQYPLREGGGLQVMAAKLHDKASAKEVLEGFVKDAEQWFDPQRLSSSQKERRKKQESSGKMYNRYDVSDEDREKALQEHNTGVWELNCNAVALDYIFSYIKETVFNDVLQHADYIVGTLKHIEEITGQDLSETIQAINDRIKISIYGRKLTKDELEDVNKLVSTARMVTSATKIAFRPVLFAKELTVGTTKLLSMCKFGWFANENIKTKDLLRAMSEVYGVDFMSQGKKILGQMPRHIFDKIGQLNAEYGIANFDTNIMAKRLQVDRFGMSADFGRMAYSTSTVPDFYNRMSIFVAAMIAQGCYDAHVMEDGVLVYKMERDKRFAKWWAKRNDSPSTWDQECFDQKALYEAMAAEFNEQGQYVDTSKLEPIPQAFTPNQKASINESITTVLGAYDHELGDTFHNGQHALFFTQFMTYFSGECKKYFASGKGNTSVGRYVKKQINGKEVRTNKVQDPMTGDQLEFTQEDIGVRCTQEEWDKMSPIMVWQGHPIEGLCVSFLKTVKDCFSGEIKRKWNSDDDMDKQQIANTKVFLFNIMYWAFLGMLLGSLLGLMGFEDEEEMGYLGAQAYSMLSDRVSKEFSMSESIFAPLLDLGFVGVDTIQQMASDAVNLVSKGDYHVTNFIHENIATIKDLNLIS